MKIFSLPATISSDLDWRAHLEEMAGEKESFWVHLEFGFKEGFILNETASFHAFVLALDEFTKHVWPLIKERCQGVILFKGSLDIFSHLAVSDEDLTPVAAATVFGDYLHRLASFLPDELPAYALFETCKESHFTLGEVAQLLSKDRFWHLHLSLTPPVENHRGILLPSDEHCSPKVIRELDRILAEDSHVRVIPERRLSEMWMGLDTLIVFTEAVSPYGKRQILGFEVAGGVVIDAMSEFFEEENSHV